MANRLPKKYGECEGITRECEGITRECEGITRECEGITGECEGVTRECEGITRECKGITRECKGITRACKGITRECEGVTRECEGVARECVGITRECRRYGVAECYDRWTLDVGRVTVQLGFSREDRYAFLFHIGVVPTADIYEVRIPKLLGGLRGYRRLLGRLERFSDLGPTYWRRKLEVGETDWRFDFAGYRRRARAYRERAARDWGWSGRDSASELKTEFFTVYRYLRMRRACALVRESILESLSAVLSRSGIEARISAIGLPSPEAIERAILQLERGEISLEDAYKLVSA
jgi:hypothetical protein